MKSNTRKLPKIGSLVHLYPWSAKMDYVKVESLLDHDAVRDFPPGTVAMIIDHVRHPDDSSQVVPLVLVDSFTGWVFCDEWKTIN